MRHRAFLAATAAILVSILAGQTAICLAAGGDMGLGTEPLTDGSAGYPYLIEDLADFDVFAGNSSYWASGVHTKLACDPSLAGRTYTTAVIAPQGSAGFQGIFDGDGHVISNLIIDTAGADNAYLGLFGIINAVAEVKNLGVVNCSIIGGGAAGGLCGKNSGTITNCYAEGSVEGNGNLGGLCGYNGGGTITNCYAGGSVTGGTNLGGLCGHNRDIISNCYSTGMVTGDDYLGGLCGRSSSGGTVTNCYSTGMVTGDDYVGGLCGVNSSTITNSFWDIETSGLTYSDGGTGKTTTEMTEPNAFTFTDAGWDFVTVWDVPSGGGYPYFLWEGAKIGLSTDEFFFATDLGGGGPADQTLMIFNAATDVLNWQISEDCSWLTAVPASGNSTGEWDDVALQIDPSGLISGFYTCEMTVSDPDADNNPQTVTVVLRVGPAIDLSQSSFSMEAIEFGPNPADQVLSVRNSCVGTLNWQITEDCSWLTVDTYSGSSTGEWDDVALQVDSSGLTAGVYTCEIIVSDPDADNSPQTVTVDLTVGPVIGLSKTSLSFVAFELDPNPADQTFTVSNVGGGTLNWDIVEDCNWLTVSPLSGSSTGEADTVTLSVDASIVAVGDYSCQLTVSDVNASNSPQTVDVTLSKSDTCTPSCHPDFDEWVSVGSPESWCNPRQCKGDTLGNLMGDPKNGYYYVGPGDHSVFINDWKTKEPPDGPGLDPDSVYYLGADLDHRKAGSPYTGYYRVGTTDLNIIYKYWNIKEPLAGPGITPDCLECGGGGAGMEGPVLSLQVDTGGGFYDPGDAVELSLDQVVTIGITNSTSDVTNYYDAYVEMAGDLPNGEWTGTSWFDPAVLDSSWTYFGTSVLPDKDAWGIELYDGNFEGVSYPVPTTVSSYVEYRKVGLGDTTIILYNEFYEEVDTLVITGEPVVLVTDPNGTESLIAGETFPITWQGNASNVKIEYSDANGLDGTWEIIDANTPSDGQYDWTVPLIDSDECLISISDVDDPGVSDESDELFTIYQCQLDSPADFDSDCQVGVSDLGIMMLNWLGGDSIADIAPPPDGDLEVDIRDFALFSADWMRNGNPFDPGYTEAP